MQNQTTCSVVHLCCPFARSPKRKSKVLQECFLEADIFIFVPTLKCGFPAFLCHHLEKSKRSVVGTATFFGKGHKRSFLSVLLEVHQGFRGKTCGVIEELPSVVLEEEAGNFRGEKALISFQN